ncbi:F-actin-uncapping protein LRRC16A isoform X3 [Centruroides vittatus]|uniref:F-actin-uncapping protein LRRC16A isoform X3 n=1 Tax=Centruroides vittatus TaxID=120091 RepID=UPI00350F74F7
MSTKIITSMELHESIRNVLGRNVKISLKCLVRMETKPDKTENRVLAFSACRLFILIAKVPTKIEHTFHYLDIEAIESKKQHQLCLSIDGKVYTFYTLDPNDDDVDHMIMQLGTALKSIFPQVPLDHVIRKIDVVPSSRLQSMIEYNEGLENKDCGPCGGYSTQYACMCDYHVLPYREEVAWDVDTIYLSHDCKELSLQDFDHLEGRDLVPIISALSFNAWFIKFRASNTKLISEALEQLLQVMKHSVSLEELYLDNIGVKGDFAHKLSLALISNANTPLHTLDLSNNLIEDKGINSLCGIIAKITQGAGHLSGTVGKLQKGLIHLNLSRTGLTSKGVNTLAHALSLNRAMPSTLTYLNLSDNVFKEDINNLYNFLAQPNALTHLDLSGTECALDTVFGALLRGCTQKLAVLNLSRNQFSTKKSKEVIVPPSFKTFFSSTIALKVLNMSSNKLPVESLKAMLLGLACNEIATDISLDLSNNDLKSQGALVLESCLPGIRCLCSLDISENNFDVDLAGIISAVGKNKSIKHLYIGKNFINIKAKHMGRIIDAIVQLIQEEDTVLETLSLADSKLRSDTCLIINALGSNQSLTSIDVSGNFMGAAGAKTLAKALQVNSKLKSVIWDRNATPAQGFQDIAYALEKNYSLKYMPWPIHDVTSAMKVAPDKTEAAFRKIDEYLHRNVSPKKYINSQAFRLQQGFLLTSTQQMVDRLMVHLQDTINNAKKSAAAGNMYQERIAIAEGYLNDANNAKQLFTRLHEVVLQQEEAGNPIEIKLQEFVQELTRTLDTYLMNIASCMLKCIEDQCPNIISDEKVRRDVEKLCQERGTIPSEFIALTLLEQAGTDIINKVSEVNLSVAAHVTDRILDDVIESLSRMHKELLEIIKQQRSTTPDVLRSRGRTENFLRVNHGGNSQIDNLSEQSDSPLATPKLTSKRRSVHTRKLRPQSVVDSVEGIIIDDIPDLLPKGIEVESLPSLSPTSEKLEHLGKGRPKRPKTRAPTRPAIQTKEIREDIQDLGEGLEVFFRRHANSSSTPTLSPDSEEPSGRARTDSNSTTASCVSGDLMSSESSCKLEKSPEKESDKKEKGSFIKGISSLFSRVATEAAHIHKSKSYDVSDKSSSADPSPTHLIGKERESRYLQPGFGNNGERSHFSSSPQLDSRSKKDIEDISRIRGLDKFSSGLTSGSGLMAEMKARQEKRASNIPVSKQECEDKSPIDGRDSTQNLLQSVKLKPVNLAQSLKSPSESLQLEKHEEVVTSLGRPTSSPIINISPGGSPQLGESGSKFGFALKPKPPPIAPKPRPKSVGGTTELHLTGEFALTNEDDGESSVNVESENFEHLGDIASHMHHSENIDNKELSDQLLHASEENSSDNFLKCNNNQSILSDQDPGKKLCLLSNISTDTSTHQDNLIKYDAKVISTEHGNNRETSSVYSENSALITKREVINEDIVDV